MRRKRRKGGGKQHDVTIERLGGRGDGLARSTDVNGRPVTLFAPLTAVGDRVLLREVSPIGDGIVAEIVELITPSPDRAEPPCPHYGACGGCQLQHLRAEAYQDWKQARAAEACQRIAGQSAMLAPLVSLPAASRRRARVVLQLNPGKPPVWGYRGRASHELAAIDHCLVLDPAFEQALTAVLAQLAAGLTAPVSAELLATDSDSGLDLLLRGEGAPSLDLRLAAGGLGDITALARLAWQDGLAEPELLVERQPPTIKLGGLVLPLPPGAFLQPSRAGEAALQALVAEAIGTARRIADLFCGLGTFSLPLATDGSGRRINAYDSFAPSVQLLARLGAQRGLTAERRDLERQPLSVEALDGFDAVLLDPPRAGAKEQIERLAQSAVPRIVYISCNPTTLARDGALLAAGGYRLTRATAVDQFTWSAQLEMVALFERLTDW